MNPVIEALLNRSSEPKLTTPAPPASVLEQAFACAARAPDHALLRPWRYLVVEGEGLQQLGSLFEASATDSDSERQREKLRAMPLRAPMVVVAIASPVSHPKVPVQEQNYSCAAGVAYLVLALHSAGFGAMWRTGDVAERARVREGLGLQPTESIVGFIYTGTVTAEKPAVPRAEVSQFVSRWPQPED
ncbi:nitroreductase [uncultured Marinobacter sp.]|uniref:nitroreductase family protein n=1 Tax=uncultured Marinobacter sp. TaxID=187379 RepID=UPI0030DBD50E